MKYLSVLLLIFIIHTRSYTQQLVESNLPIIIITTDNSEDIVDEPKIPAIMKIIYNKNGIMNNINQDSFHFEGVIGIELRGQSSLALFPKKGYGIETRDEDGEDKDVAILDMPEESDWVIHSPYSDKSLLRNAIVYSLAGDMMSYAPRVKLCELIINDEYLGVILFTEKIKRDKNRVDINKLKDDENEGDDLTGGYILKFDKADSDEYAWTSPYRPIANRSTNTNFIYNYPKPEDITNEQKSYIREYITEFENVLNSSNFTDPTNGYRKYIDPSTFIDYMIVNEISKNVDGYRLSTYMYKDKDSNDGKLSMGPVWDFNLAFGNADYCAGSVTSGWAYDFNEVCPDDYWVIHFWWKRLLEDEAFRQELKDRYFSLRSDLLRTDRIINMIDSLTTEVDIAKDRNFIKWPVIGSYVWPNNFVGNSYASEIDYLKVWITNRLEWLDININNLTTSIKDISANNPYIIYPNPTSGFLTVENIDKSTIEFIELYNSMGQLIQQSSYKDHLDINPHLANGVYILRIKEKESKVSNHKVTLER